MSELVDELDRAIAGPESDPPVPTGLDTVDRLLGGGLRRGQLVTLTGKPGVGTSMLALQVASHVAIELEAPTLVLAPDADGLETNRRVIARVARVPVHVLRGSRPVADRWTSQLVEARERLVRAPLKISAGWTHVSTNRLLRASADLSPLGGLMVVDADIDRHTAIRLRRLSRAASCALLVVTPNVIESADVTLTLDRDTRRDPSRLDASLSVVRDRHGGMVEPVSLGFQGHYARFLDTQLSLVRVTPSKPGCPAAERPTAP